MANPLFRLPFRPGFLVPLFLLLCGCSQISGKLLIMEGNFFYSRGLYNEALTAYLKAQEDSLAAPYAEYNLGSAYLFLNEADAARERIAAAAAALGEKPAADHRELIFRIHYNTGVIYFEQEQYGDAAAAFRRALETDGSRVEAKRNLELSLLSQNRRGETAGALSDEAGQEEGAPRREALFEYLRQKEQNQWKSREWTDPSPASGPDY
ncbi:MAG: tetratricopeptide repeat protein [Treponema sp.]|jgi:Ca-activated chloride channel family protein|nr:tetratricopeptide repeat protein [Treponema sp.]